MSIRITFAFMLLGVSVSPALAQHSWVAPYHGLVDSPFHVFGLAQTLVVEDFEDGAINQPGLTLLPPTGTHQGSLSITTTVAESTANSVAEDTGDALTGSFLLGTPIICATSYPPLCPATANVQIDETPSGPANFVGFVWTDAVRTSNDVGLPIAAVRTFDADDQLLNVEYISGLPLRDDQDVTTDDIFVGFLDDRGIRRLEFLVTTDGFGGNLSMDHLQYGMGAIPGDTNLDGTVDFPDFLTLADHFSGPGNWGDGDFNFDGLIQFDDFLKLSVNFGMTSGEAVFPVNVVPEPSLFSMFAGVAAIGLLFHTRRMNRRDRK